ncbi:MAG: hypothetical protein IPP05_08270 [Cytophagaceae bacterium]|nr:hypothetical protein [Cytophagaceae bacterium]MBK9934125.1 hypothetical protein [Cytophagaceae bacterium]
MSDVFFWILIICANTLGETAGDLISQTFNIGYGYSTLLLMSMFTIVLVVYLFTDYLKSLLYWVIVALASTAGTTISDYFTRTYFRDELHFTEHQGYWYGSLILAALLALTFFFWKFISQKIKNNKNKTGEILFWVAILCSSSLGTAVGDVLAHNTPLGFEGASFTLAICLVLIVFLAFTTHIPSKILFWGGIIFTHPIGATIGDFLTKPEGLNLGNTRSSIILIVVLGLVVTLKIKFHKPIKQ